MIDVKALFTKILDKLASTVTNISYDSSNRKLTKTINGSTTDIVSFDTVEQSTVTLKTWNYTNCDNATVTGWYFISAAQVSGGITNFPPTSDSVYFLVLNYSDNFKTQFALSRENNTHAIYWRTKVTAGWSMWHSINDGSQIRSGYISASSSANLSLAIPSTSMNAFFIKVWGGTSGGTFSEAVYFCSSITNISTTLTVLTKTNMHGTSPISVGIAHDGANETYRVKLDNTGTSGYLYTIEVGHNWGYFVY